MHEIMLALASHLMAVLMKFEADVNLWNNHLSISKLVIIPSGSSKRIVVCEIFLIDGVRFVVNTFSHNGLYASLVVDAGDYDVCDPNCIESLTSKVIELVVP